MTIQKNEKAKYSGVLIPELNYRNYKTLEETQPEYEKAFLNNNVPICRDESDLMPVVWVGFGILLGGVAMSLAK